MLLAIISIILVGLYFILLLFYRRAWLQIPRCHSVEPNATALPSISVIIAARNESQQIGKCLQSLTDQHYPESLFEVIVVDDFSEDNTREIVLSFSERWPKVRLIRLSEYLEDTQLNSFKKKAIETGISQSRGDWVVTTDADCITSPEWLMTIADCIKACNPSMIAAPVKFDTGNAKDILQKLFFVFQSLDFMTLQGVTGAAVSRGIHYMANGANLAYRKSVFEEVNGFSGIDDMASGDDMLLMEKIGFKRNICYLKSRSAIVITNPEPTLLSFFNQRIRWAGKSSAYRDSKIKWILALVYCVNVWLPVLLGCSFFIDHFWVVLVLFFALKAIAELMFLFPVSRFFNQQKYLSIFIFFQPFHILYILIAGWLGAFGSYHWKGRSVK